MINYEADSYRIFNATRDDDVGYETLSLYIAVEIGLHEGEPLFDAAFNVSTTFSDVSHDWRLASAFPSIVKGGPYYTYVVLRDTNPHLRQRISA